MFLKQKTPKHRPLEERIERPVLQTEVDETVPAPEGGYIIQRKTMPPTPAPFPDLGDADCYGIAYQQSRGIELNKVESPSRVSPMEAIDVANKAIDNMHIPNEG